MTAQKRFLQVASVWIALLATVVAPEASAETDRLGKTPVYWIDLNGVQTQHGSETLSPTRGSGFRPLSYEPITYWNRKGCWNFDDAHNTDFKCGKESSFTIFTVARGGCDCADGDVVVFCLGPKTPSEENGSEALSLVIRNCHTNAAADGCEVAVRTWDNANAAPRDVVRAAVPGCYASYRYVPIAVAYDFGSKVLTLYVNGSELASSIPGAFSGFSSETCWWQAASVRGGIPANSVLRDRVGITDFRYYREALGAVDVATLSSDYPLSDQTGEMPYYHYAFNGSRPGSPAVTNLSQALGGARVRNSDPKGFYCDNGADYFCGYSCETLRDGVCAALGLNTGGNYWPVTNSFTLSMSARLDGSRNSLLFGLGSATEAGAKHGSLALVSRDVGVVWFGPWTEEMTWNDAGGLSVYLGCVDATHYHDFTLVYDKPAGRVSLYVDGTFRGRFDFAGFTNSDEDGVHGCWAFGRPNGGVVKGLADGFGHAVEEFRFYTKVLSDGQISALADACPGWHEFSDPTGRPPCVGYSFDGEVSPLGHRLLNRNGNTFADASFSVGSYYPVRDGRSNAVRMGTTGNYGSGIQTNRPLTVFMSARAGRFDMNGVMFSVGSKSSGGIALAYKDPDTVGLFRWPQGGYVCSATVEGGAFGSCHAYAFTVDPVARTASLYVDGLLAAEGECGDDPLGDGHWQFCGVFGGTPSGLAVNTYCDVEMFRIYEPALTAAQVCTLSESYPAWRESSSSDVMPDYWYTFDAEGCVPKGTRLLAADSVYAQFPPGDSEARDGTFACTNTTRTKYSYGKAGKIVIGESFSVFISARIRKANEGKSGALFCLGSPKNGDAETLAFTGENADAVSLYAWPGGVKTLLVSAPAPGMDEDFNAYCMTWDGVRLTLYLNGVEVASKVTGTDFAGFTSSPAWQLGGGLYGGSVDDVEAAVCTIEDFRIYPVCLTAGQVAATSSALPRWPCGWLWDGGDSGSWGDAVWKCWDWSAAACGDWVTGRSLPVGQDVRFPASDAVLQLVGAAAPAAGSIRMDRTVRLSGAPLRCRALSLSDGVSFLPGTVSGLLSPGVSLAFVSSLDVEGIDYSAKDEFGNSHYITGFGRLRYGDGSVPGCVVVIR